MELQAIATSIIRLAPSLFPLIRGELCPQPPQQPGQRSHLQATISSLALDVRCQNAFATCRTARVDIDFA
jgi:hypothetical protein